jgi:predicted ATPase
LSHPETAMIESIEFTNFKALRKTTLALCPFTLLLGPNGSGKTTVLQALQTIAIFANGASPAGGLSISNYSRSSMLSVTEEDRNAAVVFNLRLSLSGHIIVTTFNWLPNGQVDTQFRVENGGAGWQSEAQLALKWLVRMQTFALDPAAIAQPSQVSAQPLQLNGTSLAAVLDDLKDNQNERWEALLADMRHWLPEYDQIQFDKPTQGSKAIVLRTKKGGHRIPAQHLSQGTLVALALLTLAYIPDPPSLVGLEEIDRGLHPRLLRRLQDAVYRLSYPDSCGETRPPIQVIATSHSPYLLERFREHPEEVVVANKSGLEVTMQRLTDVEHFQEILGHAALSDLWYSGALGGVVVNP